ncbi:MAG: hypothetical protein IJZ66_00715 [Oscillibacter sp.]|nr:hypothetical protein [Oscillibacter sp.]
MEEEGLWRLFFLTGLPEAWLALRGVQEQRCEQASEPAMTAFAARPSRKTES